jgi:hypothetical protein
MTPLDLIEKLTAEGGAIVTSNECSELEIGDARITGRFSVRDDGIGLVLRTKEWLALQKSREVAARGPCDHLTQYQTVSGHCMGCGTLLKSK